MHRREVGQAARGAGRARLDCQQDRGKKRLGTSCGRAQRVHDGPAAEPPVRTQRRASRGAGASAGSSAPSASRCRPVLATNTSSRRRLRQVERLDHAGVVERADHHRRGSPHPPGSRTAIVPVAARQRLAEAGAAPPSRARRSAGRRASASRGGVADLGLQRRRRALGDDLAAADDRDPVGELVGLLEVLGGEEDGGAPRCSAAHLLPDRLAADRVEAGGGLVEEEHLGSCTSAMARSRRRRMPPE